MKRFLTTLTLTILLFVNAGKGQNMKLYGIGGAQSNTAIGGIALPVISGNYNIPIGTMSPPTTGFSQIAIGRGSLYFVGTTYYISSTGNNTNAGTQNSPWKSLYYACQNTVAGDIIHVMSGTIVETQQCQLKVGVSLEGDGVTSIIKSSVSADWTSLLILSSASGTFGNQSISNLKFDGQSLTGFWGIEVDGRSNVSIHDIVMVDFKDRGVIITGRNDNQEAAPSVYATGNTFYNNTVSNCAAYNTPNGVYGRGCLNIGGQKGMLVYNNNISQTQRPKGYNGWPIKYANGGYLDDCRIYNNTLDKIMIHSYNGDGAWDFAIELFNVRGLQIYSNTMTGGGIDLNYQDKGIYAYSVWIHHNTVKMPTLPANMQTAVTLEFQSETVIVEDNVFDKVTIGVNYTPRPGSAITNNTIRRNLMSNVTGWFVTFGDGGSNLTNSNLDISNNTMVMASGNAGWEGISLPNVTTGSITNVSVKNNIIIGAMTGGITQYSKVGINGLNISNNDMYQNGNNNAPYLNTAPAPTNYVYQNNLFVNPQFVSTTDYHLSSLSPLNGLSIGCYVGTTPPPPPPTSCTFSYGSWATCNPTTLKQTRTYTSSPNGCTGTPPQDSITRLCTIPPIPPVADTTKCSVIIYLPVTGSNLVKRNLTYFVKRADGYYDNTGAKLDIILFKQGNQWFKL